TESPPARHNAKKSRADPAPYTAPARGGVPSGPRRGASLGRAGGVAPAPRGGRVTPGRGRVTGATADEETIPGNAGSLSSRTGPGSDMHHMRLPGREADGKEPGPF